VIVLTRCYRFPAAHVLAQPAFSEDRNREIFGKCANPGGHGHDYTLELSLTGSIDPEVGEIASPDEIDAILDEQIGQRFAHRHLNDIEPFGTLVPTAENIAVVAYDLLKPEVERRTRARVTRVRIVETRRNFVTYGEDE
jgi:6-pyruvoyltetrahydropterin/6-carboxytetrahydropterin synthase